MNPKQFLQNRSTKTVLRDCLKLAHRMVDDPIKAVAVKSLILNEFRKHKDQISNQRIYELKMNAVKGISNYIIYTVQKEHQLKPNKNIFDETQQEQLHQYEQLSQQLKQQNKANPKDPLL